MAATLDDVLAELRQLNKNVAALATRRPLQPVVAQVQLDGKHLAAIVAGEKKRRGRE